LEGQGQRSARDEDLDVAFEATAKRLKEYRVANIDELPPEVAEGIRSDSSRRRCDCPGP
jgi:hypothetical protein